VIYSCLWLLHSQKNQCKYKYNTEQMIVKRQTKAYEKFEFI
jgi:hypothetical protein